MIYIINVFTNIFDYIRQAKQDKTSKLLLICKKHWKMRNVQVTFPKL